MSCNNQADVPPGNDAKSSASVVLEHLTQTGLRTLAHDVVDYGAKIRSPVHWGLYADTYADRPGFAYLSNDHDPSSVVLATHCVRPLSGSVDVRAAARSSASRRTHTAFRVADMLDRNTAHPAPPFSLDNADFEKWDDQTGDMWEQLRHAASHVRESGSDVPSDRGAAAGATALAALASELFNTTHAALARWRDRADVELDDALSYVYRSRTAAGTHEYAALQAADARWRAASRRLEERAEAVDTALGRGRGLSIVPPSQKVCGTWAKSDPAGKSRTSEAYRTKCAEFARRSGGQYDADKSAAQNVAAFWERNPDLAKRRARKRREEQEAATHAAVRAALPGRVGRTARLIVRSAVSSVVSTTQRSARWAELILDGVERGALATLTARSDDDARLDNDDARPPTPSNKPSATPVVKTAHRKRVKQAPRTLREPQQSASALSRKFHASPFPVASWDEENASDGEWHLVEPRTRRGNRSCAPAYDESASQAPPWSAETEWTFTSMSSKQDGRGVFEEDPGNESGTTALPQPTTGVAVVVEDDALLDGQGADSFDRPTVARRASFSDLDAPWPRVAHDDDERPARRRRRCFSMDGSATNVLSNYALGRDASDLQAVLFPSPAGNSSETASTLVRPSASAADRSRTQRTARKSYGVGRSEGLKEGYEMGMWAGWVAAVQAEAERARLNPF
ncbi:hypothetical protein Q5752_000202 [Cryptotrichosporon argae]